MGFSNLGKTFLDSVNKGLKDIGVLVSESGSVSPPDSEGLKSTVEALKSIANQKYGRSIMMRGLNLAAIQEADWNKVFPYRFIILEVDQSGKYKIYKKSLSVTLPITPQNLTITSQFASQLSIGSRGVLEEHNGLNVKTITFTATTGILVSRQVYSLEDKVEGNVQAIFGGTVQAIRDFASAVASVFPRQQRNAEAIGDKELVFNGYYQYHLIRSFLEMYAELKKSPEGRGLRLGIELGKDRVIYLVTPQSFTTNKSASSPMEITYTFTGIAWGTITDNLSSDVQLPSFMGNDIATMQKILNGIRNTRKVFQRFKDIIRAAKTDVEVSVLGPLNNIILSIKEVATVDKTVSDFSEDLKKSFQNLIIKEWESLRALLSDENRKRFFVLIAPFLSNKADAAIKPDVLLDIDFTDEIPISALSLSPEQQSAVQDAIDAAVSITNNDVQNLINELEELCAALESQAVTQGVDSPAWEILNTSYETISHLYSLLADNFYGTATVGQQEAGVNPLIDFYQGYAATGDVNFIKPTAKFAIPFPFKSSLEWLAQRYLGDPTRWPEIAAVNNLQYPYIDEDGFIRPFLTNGQGRQFNIESAENLHVNQVIWIFSDTIPMQKRKIKSIQKVTDTNYIITVDGEDNLGDFLISQNAKMKTYLPNTVNSQKLIYIPIDEPSQLDKMQTKPISFIDETPEMLRLAKIDLLLDHEGDLAVSSDGFQNLAYGKNNLIQAARLKLQTIAGELLFHPDYGAGVEVGESDADITINNLADRIKESFLSDPRFSSVNKIEIKKDPGVLKIYVNVTVADNQGILPVEFEIGV